MAHFINCSSCGKQYNEQAFDKCPHCGFDPNPTTGTIFCPNRLCGKEISDKFDKCPFCGTMLREKDVIKENVPTRDSIIDYDNWDGGALSLIVMWFHFYEKCSPLRAYIILGGGIVVGFILIILGALFSEATHTERGGAYLSLIGIIIFFYSLYSIIKYATRRYLNKKDSDSSETKIRLITLVVGVCVGIILVIPSLPSLFKGKDSTDFFMGLFAIGCGIIIVNILSILRYYYKMIRNKISL